MSAHTPGPWALIDHGGGWFDIESDNERYFFVCFAGSRDSQSDQQQSSANGQLIAAAPDLLEALQTIATMYPSEMQCSIVANAAIAKATGAAT